MRTAKCSDVVCTPGLAAITTHATPVADGGNVTIVIGSDGLPVIVHLTGNGDFAVTRCANVACTSSAQVIADNQSVLLGLDASAAVGADGFPVIAHRILTNGFEDGSDLRITRCTTLTCSSAVSTTVDASANRVGYFTSIAVGADGVPIVAHRDDTASELKISRCTDAACTAVETIPNDAGPGSGFTASMITDAFGLPIIAHADGTTNSDIRVTILTSQGWGP